MTRGLRSTGNGVEDKTSATGKHGGRVKEARFGEPIIYDGQHTTELHRQSNGRPGYRRERRSGRGDCGRKAVATRPEDRHSVERKGNQKAERGQANPADWMSDKPLLIRANSVSDSKGNHFQPGNRRRKETLRRST